MEWERRIKFEISMRHTSREREGTRVHKRGEVWAGVRKLGVTGPTQA